MNLVWAVLAVVAAVAAAIGAMLLVRRKAPEGGYFADGDRASGVFGVLATGFSVLLGFLIFLAFESYDASRVGAETEALIVAQQVETAQRLPADVRTELTTELVCYARSIIGSEWTRMENHSLGDEINPWGVAMFRRLEGVELVTPLDEAAYGKWLDQTEAREAARLQRIHGAAGVMPSPLWIVLIFITLIILVYLLCFADRGERAAIQALIAGSVVAVIVSLLLLLRFLDSPFQSGVGGLQPEAMERTLVIIDQALVAIEQDLSLPCDESGRAT